MTHPVSTTYLDKQTVKVSAALPAAGAYDVPLELFCPGFDVVTLFVKYTRAGAGGSVRLLPEFMLTGSTAWYRKSLYGPPVVVAGADAAGLVQSETLLYTSTAAGAESFVFGPLELDGTIEKMRVSCAEVGAVATPGTVEIIATFGNCKGKEY